MILQKTDNYIIKSLKVTKRPTAKSYCTAINLQGNILEKFGFVGGNIVLVRFFNAKIIIETMPV